MNKTATSILMLVVVLIVIGVSYYLNTRKDILFKDLPISNVEIREAIKTQLLADNGSPTLSDSSGYILGIGDLNNDNLSDLIVSIELCGASCSNNLVIILNQIPRPVKAFFVTAEGSKNTGSYISTATIKNGIVTIKTKNETDAQTKIFTYRLVGTTLERIN